MRLISERSLRPYHPSTSLDVLSLVADERRSYNILLQVNSYYYISYLTDEMLFYHAFLGNFSTFSVVSILHNFQLISTNCTSNVYYFTVLVSNYLTIL